MHNNVTLVILAAGDSTRFREKTSIKKHWVRVDSKPIWLDVALKLNEHYSFLQVFIVAHKDEVKYMRRFCDFCVIEGGKTRQESLQNALKITKSEFIAVSDAARFELDFKVLDELFAYPLENVDCVIPTLKVVDTIFLQQQNNKEYLNRDCVRLVQTPQISRVSLLKKALKLGEFSDESSAINAINGRIATIQGSKTLDKLTYFDDIKNHNVDFVGETLVGYGFDVHRFCVGKKMILGGVEIPCEFGLEAHSDGDVLLHSLCDALLGAIGAGDIGEWFPPNDERFKNADSKLLLKEVVEFARSVGFKIINVDIMILAEIPKIIPHKEKMLDCLSEILDLRKNYINIKATTMEKMSFIGREEGICVSANATLKYELKI